MSIGVLIFLAIIVFVLSNSINVLQEYERGVVFTLGRYGGIRGPGLIIIIPVIQRVVRISLRIVVLDVPAQDVITRDNVSLKVNAVVYYRVIDPEKVVLQVENYFQATSQKAQTTLRSVLGEMELDDLLASREKINQQLQRLLDHDTEPWGVKVSKVEVKNVDLPEEMRRAMARQAEAERERRAKVIHADGEFQASQKLAEAAQVIGREPAALHLRYMQTLTEIAADKNSTILFPLPVDLLTAFQRR